ncbi:metallophosphoesterase [Xenorhabdus sp. ZM]|uniref:metallophosphoesterase n=1 Tax=Xenorhabdus szentirmaii TaxID=290112 RepID=UPI0019BA8295|nr:metallophosphoesterase [Xenorhabdus sp. ZM]MBD2806142.1 metallophosphoesterase [Xenorhabdus sp. ZM]
MQVIHPTDIHLTQSREQKILGINPYDNFDLVCEEIGKNPSLTQSKLIIVSGDIANDGDVESYRYFLHKMELLKIPCIVILGNHDQKNNFDLSLKKQQTQYRRIYAPPRYTGWHTSCGQLHVEQR